MSGWKIYSRVPQSEINDGINNTTGVLTYGSIVTDQCFGSDSDGYEITFEDFNDDEVKKFVINHPADCVDCSMLATWFIADGSNIYPLSSGAQTQFDVKNVDDCEKVIRTQAPSTYGFINTTFEPFKNGDISYVDCGTPVVYSQSGFGDSSSHHEMTYDNQGNGKYPSGGTINNTHKISYHLVNGPTEITKCIVDNTKLKEIFISSAVTSIGSGAFSGNTNLSAVTTVRVGEIKSNAFASCTKLKEVNLNDSSAYRACRGTENPLKTIRSGAFSGCSSIENLEIPNTVTEIEQNAFANCSGIKRLTVPIRALKNANEFSLSGNNGVVITGQLSSGIQINPNVFGNNSNIYIYFDNLSEDQIGQININNSTKYFNNQNQWNTFKNNCGW